MTGGFWATMYRVPLSGQPDGVADDVVVRLAPDREMGAKEAEVQRAVAAQGFTTPPVHRSEPDEITGGWWSIMDLAPGQPLLAGLDGTAALRRAPSLVRTLPVQLADAMAALHRLDPQPAADAVAAAAPGVSQTVDDVLDHLRAGATAAGRTDLADALDRLGDSQPAATNRTVLCHGDLHPFNVLDGPDGVVVLDWTAALVADPCFDVAWTRLLLANPPLHMPRALRPLVTGAGALLARRFIAGYRHSHPTVGLDHLDWFTALHAARVLVDLATSDPDGNEHHPNHQLAPAAARALSTATSLEVRT